MPRCPMSATVTWKTVRAAAVTMTAAMTAAAMLMTATAPMLVTKPAIVAARLGALALVLRRTSAAMSPMVATVRLRQCRPVVTAAPPLALGLVPPAVVHQDAVVVGCGVVTTAQPLALAATATIVVMQVVMGATAR